jgi:hypothetical protein
MKYHLLSLSSETLLSFDRPTPALSPGVCVVCVQDFTGENSFHLCTAAQVDAEEQVLHVTVFATKLEDRRLPVAPLDVLARYTKRCLRY